MDQKSNYFLARISANLKINFEKLIKTILFISLCHTHLIRNSEYIQGLVTVPVADLIGNSINNNHNNIFFKLPLAGVGINDCTRLHQALFHEIITIIEKQGKLIKIKIPNMFYESLNGEKQDQYWTLSTNITPLTEIADEHKKSLPDPISYQKTDNFENSNNSIATLIHPWCNPKTSLTYSAGTRFKLIDNSKHKFNDLITILLFNANTKKIEPTVIPKKYLFITLNHTINKKIKYFIKLLKIWTKQSTIIPYVWGGSSYTKRYKEKSFQITQKKNATYYDRPKIKDNPKTGFDCSGLIARAAQIVGIPFYYKNTSTMANNLQELSKDDSIENGDIIT